MASPNRVERRQANFSSPDEIREIVAIARDHGARTALTLNGRNTGDQYADVLRQAERAASMGVGALIVADVGTMIALDRAQLGVEIHVSTGGTTFNRETARFYQDLGADRVIVPRHVQLPEVERIVSGVDGLSFEVFALNAGCRYITGLCSFQHGIEEATRASSWRVAEGLGLGLAALNVLRKLPPPVARRVNARTDMLGAVAPCMMDFEVTVAATDGSRRETEAVRKRTRQGFVDLFYDIDTCGACALPEFQRMGVSYVKIVGRGYDSERKLRDVRLLAPLLQRLQGGEPVDMADWRSEVRERFRRIRGVDCRDLCYYESGR